MHEEYTHKLREHIEGYTHQLREHIIALRKAVTEGLTHLEWSHGSSPPIAGHDKGTWLLNEDVDVVTGPGEAPGLYIATGSTWTAEGREAASRAIASAKDCPAHTGVSIQFSPHTFGGSEYWAGEVVCYLFSLPTPPGYTVTSIHVPLTEVS